MYDALMLACQVANAWGITAVHDMTDLNQVPVYMMAARRQTLTVRVRSYVQTEDFQGELGTLRAANSAGGRYFEVAGFKSYMDGSLGSRTAYMREPFNDVDASARYPRGFRLGHAADLEQYAGISVGPTTRGCKWPSTPSATRPIMKFSISTRPSRT
jgi:predicted amidohydrolase YtcJ